MKVSFPHTDLLIEHLAQGTKVSSILFDHVHTMYVYRYIHTCIMYAYLYMCVYLVMY